MRDEIFNLILGKVNTRWGSAMALNSPTVAPILNRESFEEMLAKEVTFTPSHKPRHVKYADTVKGGLTSIPPKPQEEVVLPSKPIFQSHPEETGICTATQEFWKMWEPKISKLKDGWTSSAGLVFQSWLKDIHVHLKDRWLTPREAIQLVKTFTTKHAQDEMEFYMSMVMEEDQSFEGLVEHLHVAFQLVETCSELISNFYSWSRKNGETKDTFTYDLQVLAWKIIAWKLSFCLEAN